MVPVESGNPPTLAESTRSRYARRGIMTDIDNETVTIGPVDSLLMFTAGWNYTLPLGGPTRRAEMAILRPKDGEDTEILEYEQNIHPEGDPHWSKCACDRYQRYRLTVGQSILVGAWSWCAGKYALCGQRVMH